MASNYDMPRLFLGQAAALAAVMAAVAAVALCLAAEPESAFIPFAGILLAYGVMMFASSYVEEEHHFWYWAATAWLGYLGLKGYKRYVGSLQPVSTLQ